MFIGRLRRWERSSPVKLQIKTTFSFSKLAKFVASESFISQVSKLLGREIVESSKAFMKSGGVTPKLKESTIQIRNARGTGGTTPLYETGALANSLKATKEGIKGLHYGELHYKGFKPKQIPFKIVKGEKEWFMPNTKGIRVPARDFIAMDKAKMEKPINNLMKQIGKALKK